jgi:hypothetical protein
MIMTFIDCRATRVLGSARRMRAATFIEPAVQECTFSLSRRFSKIRVYLVPHSTTFSLTTPWQYRHDIRRRLHISGHRCLHDFSSCDKLTVSRAHVKFYEGRACCLSPSLVETTMITFSRDRATARKATFLCHVAGLVT